MFFNSYTFILLFLPLALIGYYGLNGRKKEKAALVYLIGMSLWFCGHKDAASLFVFVVSILLNYGIWHFMKRIVTARGKKVFLLAGILVNLGILFCFKYYNFFAENVNAILGGNLSYLQLSMPLGISFYTFMQISFLIDAYRGECLQTNFIDYAAYVSFFPKLIQGPIVRYDEFVVQLKEKANQEPDFIHLSKGLYAFALGLAKKVLLADTLSKIVNIGYNNIEALNSLDAILVMVCYSLQIYFDFSGYCDMAYGIGYAFNIKLPINFRSPYKATSISDFWNRWHITLTNFFTRYLYIPLGGSKKGTFRTMVNIMIVFLVSGLWHGASWTFVLWGALNGILMVFERVIKIDTLPIPKWIKQASAFLITTFAWSIFRASSMQQAMMLWKRLFIGGFGSLYQALTDCFNDLLEVKIFLRAGFHFIADIYPGIPLLLFVIFLMLACFFMKNTEEKVMQFTFSTKRIFVVVGLLFFSILSLSEITEFIYVNF